VNLEPFNKHTELIKLIISFGVDITKAGNIGITPYYISCPHNHLEVVKYLIDI
jgi:ankyrin repeat protein